MTNATCLGHWDGDCEPHSRAWSFSRRVGNCSIYANDSSTAVQEHATAVSRVNGCIRLYDILDGQHARVQLPAKTADDALGEGVIQTKGIPNCINLHKERQNQSRLYICPRMIHINLNSIDVIHLAHTFWPTRRLPTLPWRSSTGLSCLAFSSGISSFRTAMSLSGS